MKLYIVGFETSPSDETADYEHHITGDISQAFYLYLAMTNDTDFMTDGRGAEVITNIADFWASRVILDESTGLYHIYGIIDTKIRICFEMIMSSCTLEYYKYFPHFCFLKNKKKISEILLYTKTVVILLLCLIYTIYLCNQSP